MRRMPLTTTPRTITKATTMKGMSIMTTKATIMPVTTISTAPL